MHVRIRNNAMRVSLSWLLCAGALFFVPMTASAQDFGVGDFGVEFPVEPAPGVVFPTSETQINKWVFDDPQDINSLYTHGWGMWAGLTQETDQSAFKVENALVYQTWWSPADIIDKLQGKDRLSVLNLRTPQIGSGARLGPELLAITQIGKKGLKIDYAVAETVAYSPQSAMHAYTNELFFEDVLASYIAEGYIEVPDFPAATINIKPVYKLITADELNDVNNYDSLYAMPAWPGTPDISKWDDKQKEEGYPNKLWGQCVYIDMTQTGPSSASGVDTTCASPSVGNVYSLGDFFSIKITKKDQAYFKALLEEEFEKEFKKEKRHSGELKDGDILILVGMHVTTRETERWTWQTFWWAADPDHPMTPSSDAIAAARVKNLSKKAAHFAMAVADSMLVPAQPLTGGNQVGSLLPVYNPHLEAGFGTGTFGETKVVLTPGRVTTDLGVQSNCMSCHALAGYATANSTYISNYYVPLDAPNFVGGLRLDFAWSLNKPVARDPD